MNNRRNSSDNRTHDAPPDGTERSAFRKLGWSSVVAFLTYGAGAAVTYLSQLAIARITGSESYGIYAYVFAWVTILGYLAALGFDVSLLRLVPAYRAKGMSDLAHGVIRYAERRSAATSLAIVFIGLTTVLLLRGRQTPEMTRTLLIGFAVIPVLALLWIRASIVRAFGGVFSALAPDRLVRDGLLLSIMSCLILAGSGHVSAPTVMIITLISAVVGLSLVSWAQRRWWPLPRNGPRPTYAALEWRRTAFPLVAIAVAEAAMNRSGVVSLGWAGHTADAGVYALVFNVTSIVVLPRIAVNTRFAPMVSELFTKQNHDGLQDLITKAASWTLVGAVCMAVPLFFLAAPVLALFGPGFQTAVLPMRVLVISQVIAASAGSQIFLLTMTAQERSAAVIVVLAALANFGLTNLLIPMYGTLGAAIANALTLLGWNVAMAALIYRNLGVVPGMLAIFISRPAATRPRDATEMA